MHAPHVILCSRYVIREEEDAVCLIARRIGHSRLGKAVDPRLLGGICIPLSRLSHDTELQSAICVKRGRLRHSLGLGIVIFPFPIRRVN